MKLTKRQKYEYRDTDWRELKLIRVGHWLWARYKVTRKVGTVSESEAFLAACETVFSLKKELRVELKVERAAKWALRGDYGEASA